MFVMADGSAAALAVGVAGGTVDAIVAFAAAAIAVDVLDRRRAHQLGMSVLDDLPALAIRGAIIASAVALLGLPVYWSRAPDMHQVFQLLFAPAMFVAIAAILRATGYAVLRRLQASGRLVGAALIIGAGSVGAQIGHRLAEHPEYGVIPVGYVDSNHKDASDLPQPLLAGVEDLPRVIREHSIQHVFVAFGGIRDDNLVALLRECDRMNCEIFVVPRLFELGVGTSVSGEHIWGVPLIRLHRAVSRSHMWMFKRPLDVVVSALGLVLTAPLMLAIALAVRLECGRGVLFRQTRVGLNGRPFRLIKFRTMRPAAPDESVGWSEVSAERVGPVGRFLRRSSLDELPQLWNILRGQMSLVGPRPEQPRYVREFGRAYPRYKHRLRVPAGLTGLSQVHDLRGATPIEDRVSIDNFYIEHWSLWEDVKILLRTVGSVIRMRGH
jgi:exopolysaccharide biosynthesis polyprenyl glycosylphosphotransferase